MRISDWSSDVCSSDLCAPPRPARHCPERSREFLRPAPQRRRWCGSAAAAPFHRLEPPPDAGRSTRAPRRSEEHTSELQSLMRISYAVFCLKKKIHKTILQHKHKADNNNIDKTNKNKYGTLHD